jgi:DHA2 family methylenomycin A resistance protein-like MFS transporter
VFAFNIPLAAVLVVLAARFVPRLERAAAGARFDWGGVASSTVGVAAAAFAVIEGQSHGWGSLDVLGAFTVAIAATSAFVICERRVPKPLIDVSLFTRAAFAAANLAAFVVFFAFVGAIVYFSAYFQQVRGDSATAAGLDVAAIGVAYAIATIVSGRLVSRIGERIPLLLGLVIAGVATLGLLRLNADTPSGAIWWNFALLGGGIGLCGTPMSTIAMSAVDASHAGMASAIVNALRQVGQVFGVAVLGALVYAQLPGSGGGGRLDAEASALFIGGLHNALWVSGLALLAVAAACALLLGATRPIGPTTTEQLRKGR